MAKSISSAFSKITSDLERKLKRLEKTKFETKASIRLPTLDIEVDLSSLKDIEVQLEQSTNTFIQFISQDIAIKLDDSIEKFGVVDTGALRDSLIVSTSGDTVTFKYDSPYAAIQHYGGYILPYGNRSAQPVYIKPRPWMESVLESYNYEQTFYSSLTF